MSIVYLYDSTVFRYKKVLFFIGKIGVIRVKLPFDLIDILFRVNGSYMEITTLKLNDINSKLINDISTKVNETLISTNVGFNNKIILSGIGFRSWAYKINDGFKYLVLKIGFSKDLSIKVPSTVKVIILKPTLVLFKSIDKSILNQFVASLRLLKVSDSYKGKGLSCVGEKIVLKVGKK